MYLKSTLFFLVIVLSFQLSEAQTLLDTIAIKEVISLSPIKNSLQNSASSIEIINNKIIQQTDGVILTPILNRIPGVSMQQGALSTNRISIRGIGGRTRFGTDRIKTYYENIPLTTAEGTSDIEEIDLNAIENIEISKGPNSLSGAGLGGVIGLKSKPSSQGTNAFSTTTWGSYGLQKTALGFKLGNLKTTYQLGYQKLEVVGFRENSQYNRQSIQAIGNHKFNLKNKITFIGIATRLKAHIPSSISANDFENNPSIGAANWVAAQGFESYDKILLGIGHEIKFSSQFIWDNSVFMNYKKAYEPRPFDILSEKNQSIGWRSVFKIEKSILKTPLKISFGTESMFEKYAFSLFENKYQELNQGSVEGDLISTNKQKRSYIHFFAAMKIELLNNLHFESGLALNTTQYNQKFKEEQTYTVIDEKYSFGAIWSPRLAFSFAFKEGKNIFVSVSKGFSVPSVAETLTVNGQINSNLKPEIGINYEAGLKFNFLQRKIFTTVAYFYMPIQQLLLAQSVGNDQFIGINAGKTLHQGLEYSFEYSFLETNFIASKLYLSGAFNAFEFKEFIDRGNNFSGNRIPNTAKEQFHLGLDLSSKMGLVLSNSFIYLGNMALNDANSGFTSPYSLWNSKISYQKKFLPYLDFQLGVGVNNLLNNKYAASILPNASSLGGTLPRFFYPGNPVNYYSDLHFTFTF
jgi:iron complex outermembrane recepter protein